MVTFLHLVCTCIIHLLFLALLDRVAALFTNVKDQKVFFINNYDQIIQVFQEKQLLSDEIQKFEDLLMHQRELFAEEEIKAFFPKLIAFVLQVLFIPFFLFTLYQYFS